MQTLIDTTEVDLVPKNCEQLKKAMQQVSRLRSLLRFLSLSLLFILLLILSALVRFLLCHSISITGAREPRRERADDGAHHKKIRHFQSDALARIYHEDPRCLIRIMP
jgi:hypothetical protein